MREAFAAGRFVELVSLSAASASLHLRLPQELHPECPQQEEEEDERRWGRVSGSRRGGARGNVDRRACSRCPGQDERRTLESEPVSVLVSSGGPLPAAGQHAETLQATLQVADQARTEQGSAGRGTHTHTH